MALTREEAKTILRTAKAKLAEAKTKSETLAVLKEAGKAVGYTPAFRCLVMGLIPDESIKW